MRLWKKWWLSLNAILSSLFRATALLLIGFYRMTLSVWFGGACRFEPSCSCYAQEAFERHRPVRALWLSVRRLSKCHPFGPFGFDPVPELRGNFEE